MRTPAGMRKGGRLRGGASNSKVQRTGGRVLGLGGREEAVRRHNREVVGHLRRRLVVGEPVTLLGSPYRLVTEEVRREERAGVETVVVRFRLAGDERTFGFRIELSEVGDPCREDPISTYQTTLALLDEAVLVGPWSAPDPEGAVWVS